MSAPEKTSAVKARGKQAGTARANESAGARPPHRGAGFSPTIESTSGISARATTAPRRLRPMVVAGMMSGTSGDGIDVALVQCTPRARAAGIAFTLIGHKGFPFPATLRTAVLAAQDAARTSTRELAQLHWRLGLAYARACSRTLAAYPVTLDLVGCHGQTIYHQAVPASYAGERFACTWQIGEMAPLAQAAGCPVVSNFRAADMVAGGQGAPLVSLLDQTLYRDARCTRVLQNLGGIGNLTAVPPYGSTAPVIAFDTGPANMVIDALMQQLYDRPYDRNGAVAARGRVLLPVVESTLAGSFFGQPPPRAGGREQFGAGFTRAFLQAIRKYSKAPEDAIATATALTAQSVALALERFLPAAASPLELLVSGGGARNRTLMRSLAVLLKLRSIPVLALSDPSLPTPLPVEAKEAAAFALLAYMSHHGHPGNVPSATGARAAVVLGEVTCG